MTTSTRVRRSRSVPRMVPLAEEDVGCLGILAGGASIGPLIRAILEDAAAHPATAPRPRVRREGLRKVRCCFRVATRALEAADAWCGDGPRTVLLAEWIEGWIDARIRSPIPELIGLDRQGRPVRAASPVFHPEGAGDVQLSDQARAVLVPGAELPERRVVLAKPGAPVGARHFERYMRAGAIFGVGPAVEGLIAVRRHPPAPGTALRWILGVDSLYDPAVEPTDPAITEVILKALEAILQEWALQGVDGVRVWVTPIPTAPDSEAAAEPPSTAYRLTIVRGQPVPAHARCIEAVRAGRPLTPEDLAWLREEDLQGAELSAPRRAPTDPPARQASEDTRSPRS